MIEKKGERSKTWDDFTAELPDEDCRYAVIDVEFETDDGRPTSKIVFLSWCVRLVVRGGRSIVWEKWWRPPS